MAEVISYQNLIIPIVRTRRRKTVSIRIKKSQAQVHAPMGVSQSFIQAFVISKISWIQKHLDANNKKAQQNAAHKFKLHESASVRIFGQDLILRLVPNLSAVFMQSGDTLLVKTNARLSSEQTLFTGLRAYAFEQGASTIQTLVAKYSNLLGVQPKRISIKEYRSRWGSCNARKEVQFNWLIALAPPQALEYVVVHELCHLIHFNHSPAFWAEVARALPDFALWRRWFSTYGETLWSVLDHKPNVN